jgi:DNA-binding beta-propeller fold protein YncE
MKIPEQLFRFLFAMTIGLMLINPVTADGERHPHRSQGKIVVANRASASLSVIDVRTDSVTNIDLPPGDNPTQPMYVVHSAKAGRVFVGDRGNNRVVVLDDEDFSIETTVPTGNGVFHMWADPADNQLWVNNDIDNTITVIDPVSLHTLATVPLPSDLVALGGKPHDVILDPSGRAAYVTMVGFAAANDYVIKFSTDSFTEIARAEVGKDPHVSLTRRNKLLYVPCQNSNRVYILNRKNLVLVKTLDVAAAHGAGMPRNGKTFYTTNISGGGSNGIYAIDTRSNRVLAAVDTPLPVAHNIALTLRGHKLYVTHSGASSDQVSVYRINHKTRLPVLSSSVTVGFNPFGLAFVR